jgi:16S rRNA (cytosine967-C5)-methyltransferase
VNIPHAPFVFTIADVPCTGSGTWGRTPEQLHFFQNNKINEYADLQKKLMKGIIKNVSAGGLILYTTCSVFRKENEEQVDHMLETSGLELIKMQVFKGYKIKGDTMFAALLKKPL